MRSVSLAVLLVALAAAVAVPVLAGQDDYRQLDPYRRYFSGHWCDCWRRVNVTVPEISKPYEGVLPRGGIPNWSKQKLLTMSGVTPAERLLFQSLQGQVAARKAMWIAVEQGDFWQEGQRKPWKDGVTGKPLKGKYREGYNDPQMINQEAGYQIDRNGLIEACKRWVTLLEPKLFKGAIIYDAALIDPAAKPPQPRAVLNVVRTMCAIENALPVTEELYISLKQQIGDFPVILDTRQKKEWMNATYNDSPEEAARAVYAWAFNNLWSKCDKHCLVFAPPLGRKGQSVDITDYAEQFKMFCFYSEGESKKEEKHLEYILTQTPANIPIVGTLTDKSGKEAADAETRLLRLFSRFGKYFIDFDGAINMSFHTGERLEKRDTFKQKPPHKIDFEKDKTYLAICLSGGNSVGQFLRERPRHWDMASRGKVPVGWAIPLSVADACPNIVKFYYNAATENDGFVADIGGMGKVNTAVLGAGTNKQTEVVQSYAKAVDTYADYLDIKLVWTDLVDKATQAAFAKGLAKGKAMLNGIDAGGSFLSHTAYLVDDKPVFHSYLEPIKAKDDFDKIPDKLPKSGFVFIPVDETAFGPRDDVVGMIEQLSTRLPAHCKLVRPDELDAVYRQAVAAGAVKTDAPKVKRAANDGPATKLRKVAAGSIHIDGNDGDWKRLGEPFRIGDVASARAAHDDKFLYVFVEVTDDKLVVDDYDLTAGDAVELLLDAREGHFRGPRITEGFYRLSLVPNAGLLPRPALLLRYPTFDIGLVSNNRNGIEEKLACRTADGKYVIEAAVPLLNFPLAKWESGTTIGFGLAVNNYDGTGHARRVEMSAASTLDNALSLPEAEVE